MSKSNDAQVSEAVRSLSGIPLIDDEPYFAEPWQAQVFAMTLHLNEQKLFSWVEWAHSLSAEITKAQAAGDPDLGNTYYNHWLAALEQLLMKKGFASREQLVDLRDRWDSAAHSTPHGEPIVIGPVILDELAR